MITNIPEHLNKNFPDTDRPHLFGRLELPTIPPWSYPPHAHHSTNAERPNEEPSQSRYEEAYQEHAARLQEMPPEVLRPIRVGHDYVGGWIAGLIVLTLAITLLLLVI
jgi:hypothetical protein